MRFLFRVVCCTDDESKVERNHDSYLINAIHQLFPTRILDKITPYQQDTKYPSRIRTNKELIYIYVLKKGWIGLVHKSTNSCQPKRGSNHYCACLIKLLLKFAARHLRCALSRENFPPRQGNSIAQSSEKINSSWTGGVRAVAFNST